MFRFIPLYFLSPYSSSINFESSIRIWKSVLQKGDSAIDATCGNGHDTLAILGLVGDDSGDGLVHAFDVQASALENTFSLLEESVDEERVMLRSELA